VRISAFQVIATATLAAEVAAGGLGRYIVDGFAVRDDTQIFAGALVVVLLAFVVEAMFAGLQRALVPSALRRPRSFNPDPRLEDITHETLEIAA
jgi:osmoprotectant transport system permease protein